MIMELYRRSSRLIFVGVRRYSSNNTSVMIPIQESFSRTNFYRNFSNPSFNKSRKSQLSLPIFSNSALQNGFKSVHCNSPFLNGAKRFYSAQGKYREWISDLVGWGLLFSFGILDLILNPVTLGFILLYILLEEDEKPKVLTHKQNEKPKVLKHKQNGHLETVAFTNRVHYNTISREYEEEWGRRLFENRRRCAYKDRVLPSDHPENIRVQRIARSIIEALERGLEGTKSKKRDLEGLKWEVIVVDDPENDAYSFPGGKIVIFTELLKHITSDAELAAVIAHEVAHSVARHEAEIYSKFKWLDDSKPITEQISAPSFFHILRLLLIVPLSMRLDFEADYIGLLLMARGGYDPQVAPRLIKKFGYPWFHAFLRVKLLSRAKVMQEAMRLYMETIEKELRALRNFAISKHE